MREDSAIPLVVDSPAGRADLIVDGALALDSLASALLAATGMSTDGNVGRYQFWEGQRQLDASLSLLQQGVVAGSELVLRQRGQFSQVVVASRSSV